MGLPEFCDPDPFRDGASYVTDLFLVEPQEPRALLRSWSALFARWSAVCSSKSKKQVLTLSRVDYQSPPSVLPTRSMSAPSVARDRLHVIGSSCRFAGVMPAPKPHSERPGFDCRARSCHVCRLTSDAAHLLVGAVVVTFSFSHVRDSCLQSLSSCPDLVSKRSEAP